MKCHFQEGHSPFAILSTQKFEKYFPNGYTLEHEEAVATNLLERFGHY